MTYKWAKIAGNNDYSHDDHDAGSVGAKEQTKDDDDNDIIIHIIYSVVMIT